jgi:hypothetical protein
MVSPQEFAMSQPVWIVVANGASARAFERRSAQGPLVELQHWEHPQTRMHASELSRDHPGPGHSGRGGLTPRIEERHKARQQFAQVLSQWLQARLGQQNQGQVALFSSNPFLGELMAELPEGVHTHVCASHPTDLTSLPFQALDERLRRDYRL